MVPDNQEEFRSYFKIVYQFDVSSPQLHPLRVVYMHTVSIIMYTGVCILTMFSTGNYAHSSVSQSLLDVDHTSLLKQLCVHVVCRYV